ncbi:hypothetical protein [Candidatus Odyssella acanthamoebae]|uniref:hypothetical protein n=1 Tax=Candidatus Odyssella acanthamoebae TaxID=91604 RepID=UPI0012EC5EBF|nr:hypothetical protein [Candidatus Paracaedibacter acanthamoebae]
MHSWLCEGGRIAPVDVTRSISLPPFFCLPDNIEKKDLEDKARQWAKDHGLPESIVGP